MEKITAQELKNIVFNTPSFLKVREARGKNEESHSAHTWAGMAMCDIAFVDAEKAGQDVIAAFVKEEKDQLTDPECLPLARKKLRAIYDEVRAELARRGIEVPARDESNWQIRVSENPSQKSFDPKTGYNRGGD